MNTLSEPRVAGSLERLFKEAEHADRSILEALADGGGSIEDAVSEIVAAEAADLGRVYRERSGNYLSVSPEFGRFLYMGARASRATRIVEFGTSMGISTIHLAAALRDVGGGRLIGTELEPSKVVRARANLEQAGLSDLVEIREGDARETLRETGGPIDLVLLDGAFSLYLEVLRILQPNLRPGALIIAENAFEQADGYLNHVRDPASRYVSCPLALNEGRGNELTVFTG